MKLKLVAGLVAALSITSAQAEPTSSVWKVSKGNDYIYVGGTVHILPASEFPLPGAFDKAYKDSQGIVLEADLPDPNDVQAQMQMMQAMAYSDGRTLKDVLKPKTFQALSEYFAQFGASAEQLQGFKPGFIMTMMLAMEAQKEQMAGEGVDAYFDKLAEKDKKLIEYLETTEFQIDMLANLGEGDEDKFINMNLQQMSEFKPLMLKMIKAWKTGDVKVIDDVLSAQMKDESPEIYETMITARNKDWIAKIERLFGDNDKEFVLVGAGHLAGDDSVLKLLSDKGYKISQM